ncbi:UbiH/UbiF family hydroxylase [Uliginosibacterium sp. H1]|uniref:UbiH/UbiF family hydroxylase n=1 Tax=Uliginosibacterium sp. H1 TaxID=3114757 RepID=UPI002E17E4C8|nr:UbiH/UbiF family hydroxylase [Uliginosibacterium sp. H1]
MQVDIAIVGAGLAGASLACALRGSRYKVALLERAAPVAAAGWDARVYAIAPANVDFLRRCGVWDLLDATRLQAIERMDVHGDAGGHIDFSAYDCGMEALAWMAESGRLASELWETARRQPNVSVVCPAQLQSLVQEADAVRLQLADGREVVTRLLVGADGVNSWVREQAGIAAETRPYAQQGVVANFETARPHFGTAWQWFRRDGVLAWLPLPGNRISIVWSTPESHAQDLLAMSPEALSRAVAAAGNDTLGPLSLLTPPAAFPLRWMRVREPVAPRLALIGDAAHAIHPLSGHGINLGFQDARVLADELLGLPAVRDVGDVAVLRRYVRKRAEEVMLVQTVTDGMQKLFEQDMAPLGVLRNLGMSVAGRLPVLRAAMVRYAAGLM